MTEETKAFMRMFEPTDGEIIEVLNYVNTIYYWQMPAIDYWIDEEYFNLDCDHSHFDWNELNSEVLFCSYCGWFWLVDPDEFESTAVLQSDLFVRRDGV